VTKKSTHGAGAPSRRSGVLRPEGGPSPTQPAPFRHLAHLPSFRDNPIVFFTACSFQRRKILASAKCEETLREIWQRSAEHDGWYIGHYILMPDHVHFFARLAIDARPLADWVRCGKASALDESRRRLPSIRRSGRRIILIDISDPAKATLKNGITLSKTQFGLASSRP